MLSSNTRTAAELAAERSQRVQAAEETKEHVTQIEFDMFRADMSKQLKELKKEIWHLSKHMSPAQPVEAAMQGASMQTGAASVSPATPTTQVMVKRRSLNKKGKL